MKFSRKLRGMSTYIRILYKKAVLNTECIELASFSNDPKYFFIKLVISCGSHKLTIRNVKKINVNPFAMVFLATGHTQGNFSAFACVRFPYRNMPALV